MKIDNDNYGLAIDPKIYVTKYTLYNIIETDAFLN